MQICKVLHKRIPKAVELKIIPMYKVQKCKTFSLETRFDVEILLSNENGYKGYLGNISL